MSATSSTRLRMDASRWRPGVGLALAAMTLASGCGDSVGSDVGHQATTAAAQSPSEELDYDSARKASPDRDCDGVTDIDDTNIVLVPDTDHDRYGNPCDRFPADPTRH
jgi:hypothetical protein